MSHVNEDFGIIYRLPTILDFYTVMPVVYKYDI